MCFRRDLTLNAVFLLPFQFSSFPSLLLFAVFALLIETFLFDLPKTGDRSDRETADAFRWLCASSHYRNRFEFTPEKMAEAIERVKGVQRALKEVETLSEKWRRDEVLLRETAAASVGSSLEGSGAFYPSTLRRASLTAADLQLWHTFERSEERFAR